MPVAIVVAPWFLSRGVRHWPVRPKHAVPFSKFLVSKFFSLGSDKDFGGCIKGRFFNFFIYWFFSGTIRQVLSNAQSHSIFPWLVPFVSDLSLWQNRSHKDLCDINSSIHVKFLFHFIGISRAGRGAWNTGNCWTWSKSLIGSENTKWNENMTL